MGYWCVAQAGLEPPLRVPQRWGTRVPPCLSHLLCHIKQKKKKNPIMHFQFHVLPNERKQYWIFMEPSWPIWEKKKVARCLLIVSELPLDLWLCHICSADLEGRRLCTSAFCFLAESQDIYPLACHIRLLWKASELTLIFILGRAGWQARFRNSTHKDR